MVLISKQLKLLIEKEKDTEKIKFPCVTTKSQLCKNKFASLLAMTKKIKFSNSFLNTLKLLSGEVFLPIW